MREVYTTYADARVLEEGLLGNGQERGKEEQGVEEDDTDDHPNVRLQWTWTVLRR